MSRKVLARAMLLGVSFGLAACQKADVLDGRISHAQSMLADGSDGDDWAGYGRTFGEQHFSPLQQISDQTVTDLGLVWYMDLPPGNPATIPVEVGGVLYVAYGLSIVRAVDVQTGRQIWEYDSRTGEMAGARLRQGWGIRGLAYWNGKVYTGTGDGRLIAVDAKTGQERWSVSTVEDGDFRYITGAPRIFDGKVIIGHGGGDSASIRGYVTAYDAETGQQVWRFYTVPGQPGVDDDETTRIAAHSWAGEWWKHGGGGNAWNAFAYDAESETVLVGTGNGSPWNRKVRSADKGDNLFLCSVVALDARTGRYKWHYQFNPGETWDYNAAMDLELADLKIDGQLRKVVITAPKNGFFYVIDRTSGKLISAEKIAKVTWATRIDLSTGRPVEVASARFSDGKPVEVWPSFRGAHSWMPMAFSPQTGLAYIPKLESGAIYSDEGIDPRTWRRAGGNAVDLGLNLTFEVKDPLHNTSSLLAWNPVTQKKAWEVRTIGGWNGGIMATGGNLVFQGQLNGRFSAYAADSGRELWRFDAQNAVLGAPISYLANGKQYVTVVAGMGTSVATYAAPLGGLTFDYRTQKRRILTFALGGTAKLPPAPPPFRIKPIADPGFKPDASLAARGAALFGGRCTPCHGVDAIAAGGGPDLRVSQVAQDADAFREIVRNGVLVSAGMPRFDDMTDQELEATRHYIRTRSAALRAEERSPGGAGAR